ncbi:MAG: hypothetical protein AB1898_31685 [Acidobacteriota bacterium]
MKPSACRIFRQACALSALVAASVLQMPGHAEAQTTEASVVLVHLTYAGGQWAVGPEGVKILPCKAPSNEIDGSSRDPRIRVLGSNAQVLYERNIRNPRRALREEPSSLPELLGTISYRAKFPLAIGMQTFQFWYDPVNQTTPTLIVDLAKAISEYWANGGPSQDAPCKRTVDFFN